MLNKAFMLCHDNRTFFEKLYQDYLPVSIFLLFGVLIPIILFYCSLAFFIAGFSIKDKIIKKKKNKIAAILLLIAIILPIVIYFTCLFYTTLVQNWC